jgi:cobalt-zinc-cadmium efflux system outer membrane protein
MTRRAIGCRSLLAGATLWATGCGLDVAAPAPEFRMPPPARLAPASATDTARGKVVQAGSQEAEDAAAPAPPAGVDGLVRLAVERNPRLARATFAIDAARGRYTQAGLYPNPDLAVNWDEIGDRTGPGGILFAPRLSQTFVTGHKLTLAQAVVAAEVDQSSLALMNERYAVIAAVRAAYYDVLALQRRIEVLRELVRLTEEAAKHGETLLENKQIARLDLIQLQAEAARFRADAEAAEQELPAARRRLAAVVGDPRLPVGVLDGPFETVPAYDPDRTLEAVLATHPEVRSARVGVERAQAAVRRAEVEPIPNVSAYTGYIRQYENKSHDFALGVSAPIPVWNRNQGSIRAAKAELGMAVQEVGRVENTLAEQVASAFRIYLAAVRRAERYKTEIIPKAREAADLSARAFKEGQFAYLRVIVANRAVAEAQLEYVRSLGEAWRAAAELSGLLLEESWPERVSLPPIPPMGPCAGPAVLPIPPTGKTGR